MVIFNKNLNIFKISVFLASIFLIYHVFASSNATSGGATTGCSCHGGQSSATTVTSSVSGGSWTFNPGEQKTITITVSNSSLLNAGMKASVKTASSGGGSNAGTIVAGTGTKIINGEAAHNNPQALSGGSYAFTFNWTAPATAGTYYLNASGNAVNGSGTGGDAWNKMLQRQIIVESKSVSLTSFKDGDNVCAGDSEDITWNSEGVSNIKIELSKNGGSSYNETIVATTSASTGSYSWQIPASEDGTMYKIRISDVTNSTIKSESNSNFTIGGIHSITTQPQSKVSCTGENVTFSVVASGSAITYQWKKDGVAIVNQTNSSITLNNIDDDDGGNYTCEVNSTCGDTVTSDVASLTVNVSPKINSFPTIQDVCENGNLTLTVDAEGGTLTYRWLKNNVEISSETSSSFEIQNASSADAGNYKVEVSNLDCGSVTSNVCTVTVKTAPQVTQQIQVSSLCENQEVSAWIQSSGVNKSYQWFLDGDPVSGSSDTYTFNKPAGTYNLKCRVSNSCGNDESESFSLTIPATPTIEFNQKEFIVANGESVTIESTIQNNSNWGSSSFQWYFNNDPLVGAVGKDLLLSNLSDINAGDYYLEYTYDCGSVQSEVIKISVSSDDPKAVVSFAKDTLNFGFNLIGKQTNKKFEDFIINSGDGVLSIEKYSTDNSEFSIPDNLAKIILPGESLDLVLGFNPATEGQSTGNFKIISNSGTFIIPMIAQGVTQLPLEVEIDSEDLVFETITNMEQVSSNTITLTNQADRERQLTLINITNPNNFIISSENTEIEELSSLNLVVDFKASESGTFTSDLNIEIDNQEAFTISLYGVADIVGNVLNAVNSMAAYPNPTYNSINISVDLVKSGLYNYLIFDSNGNKVADLGTKRSLGSNQFKWDTRDLKGNLVSNGSYILMISGENRQSTVTIVVNR